MLLECDIPHSTEHGKCSGEFIIFTVFSELTAFDIQLFWKRNIEVIRYNKSHRTVSFSARCERHKITTNGKIVSSSSTFVNTAACSQALKDRRRQYRTPVWNVKAENILWPWNAIHGVCARLKLLAMPLQNRCFLAMMESVKWTGQSCIREVVRSIPPHTP